MSCDSTSSALVPALLDSIELKTGKIRPTTQSHPKWELMRVHYIFIFYSFA